MVACPQSDLRQGGSVCPVARLEASGVCVGLGTDSPVDGGALDILAEARIAALLGARGDGAAPALSAATALRMATLGGATALGMGTLIGSIEPGKAADLVCLDLGSLELPASPCEPAEAIVFGATRAQVKRCVDVGPRRREQRPALAFDEHETARARRGAGPSAFVRRCST